MWWRELQATSPVVPRSSQGQPAARLQVRLRASPETAYSMLADGPIYVGAPGPHLPRRVHSRDQRRLVSIA